MPHFDAYFCCLEAVYRNIFAEFPQNEKNFVLRVTFLNSRVKKAFT